MITRNIASGLAKKTKFEQFDESSPYHKLRENKSQMQTIMTYFDESSGGFENGRVSFAYFQKWMLIELGISVLTILILGLSVIQYEMEFDEVISQSLQGMILWVIFALEIILLFMTYIRYVAFLEFQKKRNVILNEENLISSGLYIDMLQEFLILLPHPNPFLHSVKFKMVNQALGSTYEHNVNEIMNLFQLLKVMVIIRVVLMLSTFFTTSAQRVCSMYAVKPGYLFVIKSLMKAHPFQVLFVALIWSILLFAQALRICERPLNRNDLNMNFGEYKNAIWNVLVTMTTVGYGDYYARTDFGRIVAFFICIWGVCVVSLMVVTLTNFLNMGVLETKAFSIVERLVTKKEVRETAYDLVSHVLRMTVKSRRGQTIPKSDISMLRRKINDFKAINR
eukprot:TRINITY_DN5636_c0_g1_i5.p1 TRINITY_DN5636_c0_g1~~TRINITY_DN5636_c0_g1_i5.p1  ORF type:complete len:394 (+),score=93.45 TRINITY_DN5636_c0_g1_i5:76-1257(+)